MVNKKKTLKKEKKKTALVLCGGGALGAYELGAWKALRELKIDFDIVTGTSIGALLGAFVVADKYDEACQLWANITPENVCKGGMNLNRLRVKSYIRYQKDARKKLFTLVRQVMRFSGVDISPFKELVKTYLDPNAVLNSDKTFGICTCTYPRMKLLKINVHDLPEDLVIPFLHASSACFPIFPKEKIGKVRYVDGGFKDNLPIDFALELGADSIVAIGLNSIPPVPQNPELMRFPNVKTIWPRWQLGSIVDFSYAQIQRNIFLGYNETMKAYGKYDGYKYTFVKDNSYDDVATLFTKTLISTNFQAHIKLHHLLKINEEEGQASVKEYFLRAIEVIAEALKIDPTEIYTIFSLLQTIDNIIRSESLTSTYRQNLVRDKVGLIKGKYGIKQMFALIRNYVISGKTMPEFSTYSHYYKKHPERSVCIVLYVTLRDIGDLTQIEKEVKNHTSSLKEVSLQVESLKDLK